MQTKLSKVREAMAADDWTLALRLAARFPDLGSQKNAIRDGHGAIVHPRFFEQIGKSPAALIAQGRAALIERYGAPT